MKVLLATLMCMVLHSTQLFAIDGGPWGGGGGVVAVTGQYAGVMVPIPTVLDPGPPEVTLTDNSLALFTLKVPQTGLASGDAFVFRKGFFYTSADKGGIQASADPDSGKVTGIIATEFQQDRQSGTTTVTEHYEAAGQFVNVRVTANSVNSRVTAARLRGRATITYRLGTNATDPNGDSGGPITYKVHGFKQSESSS